MRFSKFILFSFFLLFTKPFEGFCEELSLVTLNKLLQTPSLEISTPKQQSYKIKKGWNTLKSPQEGIDIIKTFQSHSEISLVALYDQELHTWALYSPKNKKIIGVEKYLFLESLGASKIFFVQSEQKSSIDIKSKIVPLSCQKYQKNRRYATLLSERTMQYAQDKSIGVSPRYSNNFHRGYYNDSRILLIYPKVVTQSKALQSYGPAVPYIAIKYANEYAQKEFFVFDYMEEKCYRGFFPSKKIPPFARLQELH